jgi:hypothetical protein
MVSTSKKKKVDNYRIERYKVDKYGDIGSIQLGCYLNGSNYNDIGGPLRALRGSWNRNISKLGLDEDMGILFIPELKETIVLNHHQRGYCTFTIQFRLEGLTHHLDELIFEVLEDCLIDTIADTKLIILEK